MLLVKALSLEATKLPNADEWLEGDGAADVQKALWQDRTSVPIGSPAVAVLVKISADGKPVDVTFQPRGVSTIDVAWAAKNLFERAPESVYVLLPNLRLEVSGV